MIRKLLFVSMMCACMSAAQQSPHGRINISCDVCHSTDSWTMRTDAMFSHNSTGSALAGQHRFVQCRACHTDLVFSKQKSDCLSCHTDVHKSELGTNCPRCHTMDSWIIVDMKQKHQQTRFPLVGRHGLASCDDCHERASTQRYAGTPLTCISCHRSDYQATTSPNHTSVGFSVDCNRCHNVTAMSWPSGFDHDLTAFPLTGAHRSIVCGNCHANNQFVRVSSECYSCHAKDFTTVQSPNHVSGNFSHDCQVCHSTIGWTPATFDHSATRFPLTGDHRNLQCQACHRNGNYQLVYTGCNQCHDNDYQQSTNPNHVSGNFSHDCQTCHTTNGWSPASFDHATTKFPLTGSHVAVQCLLCHVSNNFQLTYTDCYVCHSADYQKPTDPSHVSGNFAHDCTPCHTTTVWSPSTFTHATTKFPLTGKHITTPCQSCHINANYQLTYANCYQCHQTDYQNTTNPNHVAGNFNQTCDQCHTTNGWSPATFDHSTTKFALTGKHTAISCTSCHVNNNYLLAYTDCYQCHQTDYQRPTDPNHVAANFGHDCSPCHTTTAWKPSTFDHDNQYFKIYSGKHSRRWTSCADCHANNTNYKQFSCITCHEHDQTETDSNHSGVSGYVYSSPACYNCHRNI